MTNTAATYIRAYGTVQGVGFRYRCRQRARMLGVVGWVRNRPDGSVEAVGQGSAESVAAFVEWIRQGPAGGQVDGIDISERDVDTALTSFDIRG